MSNRTKAIAAALLATLIFSALQFLPATPQVAKAQPVTPKAVIPTLNSPGPALDSKLANAREVVVSGRWPQDPFFRDIHANAGDPAQAQANVLKAVLTGPPPLALVGDQVLGVGDRLPDGSLIVAIREFAVDLEDVGGTRTLSLAP